MRKKTFLKLAEYQTEQSRRHLDDVRSIHKEMRAYKHDFHHHLQTLRSQLEAGEYDRALAYIDELDSNLLKTDTLLKTGNIALDAILSGKIAQAKAKQIAITVKANVPDQLTISDVELSILIGNLLDNAIESCERLMEVNNSGGSSADQISVDKVSAGQSLTVRANGETPFIRIFIGMKGEMLYFSMLNSAGAKQKKLSGLFATGKAGLHGFGLRRAESIIEEHGGWCKYNSEDGAFTSEFLVPAL